jgi:putative peptide zinc metalloprotease protein
MLADRPRTYLRLGPEDDYVATQMDGTRRVSDLVVDYFHRFGRFGFDRIASLVSNFRESRFLHDRPRNVYKDLQATLRPAPPPPKRSRWEGTPTKLRLPLYGIDRAVTQVHDRVAWVFFLRPVVVLTAGIFFLGLAAFVAVLRRGGDPFAPIGASHLAGLVALIVGYYLTIFVHESAHALTAKHFGTRVDEGGFVLYYFIPAFYVNVTDAWVVPWKRRIAIFWAGPYSGLVLAGMSSLLVWALPASSLLSALLFKLAVAAYINNVFNLLPLLQLDGYWILEEWSGTPRMRQLALQFVRGPMWHKIADRKPFTRREVFYALFGALTGLYSFLAVYVAVLYWFRRLKPIVRPLWSSPGWLPKLIVGLALTFVALTLGIRLGRVLLTYQAAARRAPAAARKALEALRVRERFRLLAGVAFLRSVPVARLHRLARSARIREIPAGAAAVRQGERGDEFFIIEQGEAEVLVREAGDDRLVAELRAGDFFGEGALLGTGVRQATVRAVTPLRLLVIGHRIFWSELAGAVGWQSRVRAALEERERLQTLPLFAEASPRQLDLLAVKLESRPTRAGDVIVRQGDPGDAFFIVREGRFEVEVEAAGLRQRLNVLEPGDFFGEIALLRNVPRTATVRALGDGSLWRLGREDFRDLLGRYLQLEEQIAGIASSRVARGHSSGSAA